MFGYFRRLSQSFAAMLAGFVLIPISVALHGWNEYRTVHRTRGIEEARTTVQSLSDPNRVESALAGKLVHLSGFADTEEVLKDDHFFVRERAIHLRRTVEMYQWVEKESTSGGNSNRKTEFNYSYAWVDHPVDSSRFNNPNGHRNPEMSLAGSSWQAEPVHVGAYQLTAELVTKMNNWQPVELQSAAILENTPEDLRARYLFRNNELFIGFEGPADPERPIVGDLRIRFEKVIPADVSLVAELRGNSFGEFRTSNGEGIYSLYMGVLSAGDVMARLQTENKILAWVLRFFGLVICVLGFAMCLRPLSAVVSFIPLVGQLTGGLTFAVAILLGSILSMTTIGVAWIAVRPLLGISLLALSGIGAYLVYRIRDSQTEPQIIDANLVQ